MERKAVVVLLHILGVLLLPVVVESLSGAQDICLDSCYRYPPEFPKLVSISVGSTGNSKQGAIPKGIFFETADNFCSYEVARTPFKVQTRSIRICFDQIDKARNWITVSLEKPLSGISDRKNSVLEGGLPETGELDSGIESIGSLLNGGWLRFGDKLQGFHDEKSEAVVFLTGYDNPAIFDGEKLHYYEFSRGSPDFDRTAYAWSNVHGLLVGTSHDAMIWASDYGSQGLCTLAENGVVNRVFWAPLGEKMLENLLAASQPFGEQPHWDMWALCFVGEDVLWVGSYERVFCLDMSSKTWKMFDQDNSPIFGCVTHIAVSSRDGMVRCLCRDHWQGKKHNINEQGKARIIQFSADNIMAEPIPTSAATVLNSWQTSVQSNSDGVMWFLGKTGVWCSSPSRTYLACKFPMQEMDISYGRGLFVDSAEDLWFWNNSRLWIFGKERWHELDSWRSAVSELPTDHVQIMDMTEDPKGRIWVSWQERRDDGVQPFISILGQNGRKAFDRKIADESLSEKE